MTDPIYCRACDGHGTIGPVHINHGDGRGEWVEQMRCRDCDGTGRWTAERLAAYEQGLAHRLARVVAGETILQCAQRLGISPTDVSRMERGLERGMADDIKAQVAAAMAALDFDAADKLLAQMADEPGARSDAAIHARVSCALLRGRVIDAEALIATMQDPTPAAAELADWKRRNAGLPHGQWDGGASGEEGPGA